MVDEFLGQERFRCTVLPARVAYLIAPRSSEGFRRAVQEASTRWAGVAEPIVPVRRNGQTSPWHGQVLELSKVEALVCVDADPDGSRLLSERLGLPLVDVQFIDHGGISMFSCNPVAIESVVGGRQSAVVVAAPQAPLWQVTACGSLTDEAFADMSAHGMALNRTLPEDQLGRAQLHSISLLDVGAAQFAENMATTIGTIPAVVWIIGSEPLRDCLTYWNLRALRSLSFSRSPMIVIPRDAAEHWLNFDDDLAFQLARPVDISPDVVLQGGVSPTELASIGRLLGLKRATGKVSIKTTIPPPPTRVPPFTYRSDIDPHYFVNFERSYGRIVDVNIPVFRESTLLEFESPVTFRANGLTMIRFESSALQAYPRRPAVASLIIPNASWSDGQLQILTHAMGRYSWNIAMPSTEKVLQTVLEHKAIAYRLSDKGRLAQSIDERYDIDRLLGPLVYETLMGLTTPTIGTLRAELRGRLRSGTALEDIDDLAARWGGGQRQRYLSVRQLRSAGILVSADTAEQLATLGWLERGLEIRCQRCSIRSFVALRSADEPRCPACKSLERFKTGPQELSVFYRLNGLVDRACSQGVIEHLLAVAALRRRDHRTHVLPGVDITTGEHKRELDLVGLHGAAVISGEVKRHASSFTNRQLREDLLRSSMVGADLHVLATPDTVDEAIRASAKRLAKRHHLELLVLDRESLRP